MDLAQELTARGLIEHTSADLSEILKTKRTVYLGVDPSADSMQAGNLVVVLLMKRLADAGHKIILLVGGGTGMIGDPREKGERALADKKIVERNKKAIKAQMQRIIGTKVTLVDNADWLLKIKLVDFLRDIGKHFTVNELIKRDIIKRRLENPDDSISYTEFAYSLLQGYDYMHLNQKYGADLQIGASDQWTNILSGVELIRRKLGKEAFAVCTPLITDANGKKFGKSEGNAVWLDAHKTSPYAFYQFWLNQPDEVVERYLKSYTFMQVMEIDALCELHRRNPGRREAQKMLAHQVTEIVHGKDAALRSIAVSEALYGERTLSTLSKEEQAMVLEEAPSLTISTADLAYGYTIIDALTNSNLVSSKSEARRLIESKGVTLNDEKVDSVEATLSSENFQNGLAMLKRGKQISILSLS
ncbi:MAG: tyrosine--tRNA ligase [Parcubacteria bacterium C7867-007]|nr:MAG: tyrosine--tRNA ligase [Parcubacteria bacterium C7867-007]